MSYPDPERGGSGARANKDKPADTGSSSNPQTAAAQPNPLGQQSGINLSIRPKPVASADTGNYMYPYSMQRPSEEEREWYFFGLAGGQLIARTSTGQQPWSRPSEYSSYGSKWPMRKLYVAAGAHETDDAHLIREVRAALPRIQQELDQSDVDWTWFTGIRIGLISEETSIDRQPQFDLNNDFPLVILIHVTPRSTDFEFGFRVVRDIQGILDRRNLSAIRVEMREGEVFPHSVPKELGPAVRRETFCVPPLERLTPSHEHDRDTSVAILPLMPSLGWPIQRTDDKKEHSALAGTVGLYICCGKKDLAVTCRHVLVSGGDKKGNFKDGKPEVAVSQADFKSYNSMLGKLKELQVKRENMMSKFNNITSPTDEDQEKHKASKASLQYGTQLLEIVSTVGDDFKGSSQTPVKGSGVKKRKVGKIWATPEYSVSASGDPDFVGFMNDWALVDLDPALMKGAANEFWVDPVLYTGFTGAGYMVGESAKTALIKAFFKPVLDDDDAMKARHDHNARQCFLKLQKEVSQAGRVTDLQGQGPGAQRVIMHGITSGPSLGITNGIEACIRAKKSGSRQGSKSHQQAFHSWELIVIPRHVDFRSSFSQAGDSGASVADVYGKVVGILVGGGEAGMAKEQTWRGYQDFNASIQDRLSDPRLRKARGFEKGKEPSETQNRPYGPEPSETQPLEAEKYKTEDQPYFDGIYLSFVTPMEFILKDIERVMGEKVTIM